MVFQKSAPGSADAQALSTNWSQMSFALTILVIFASSRGRLTGQRSVYFSSFSTACKKSSVNLMEMLAPVTLVRSRLMLRNVSISGWRQSIVSINAPRRPPCATSRVELLKRSMKTPMPSVVLAAFEVVIPLGRIFEMSNPTPPRRFMI